MPAAVLFRGDPPVQDNTAKRWNGVVAQKITESNATNHRRYEVSSKILDGAACTGKPLRATPRNRICCILHCSMFMGRFFVTFLGTMGMVLGVGVRIRVH